MKRILVVGAGEELNKGLQQAIGEYGDHAVIAAMTVREACLLVAQRPADLVLAPVKLAPDVERALHSLQPHLPVAPVASTAEEIEATPQAIWIGDAAAGLQPFLGEETREAEEPTLDSMELEDVALQAKLAPALTAAPAAEMTTAAQSSAPKMNGVAWPRSELLDRAATGEGKIAGSLLMRDGTISAVAGHLSDDQVQTIARRISETWRDDGSALMQFIPSEETSPQLLLFTRRAAQSQLLTLAVAPDTPVGKVRRAADRLAADLAKEEGREQSEEATPPQVVDTNGFHAKPSKPGSYALILQTRRAMPAALQAAVDRALQEVADVAGCELLHRQVGEQIVHFVTSCPGAHGSGWLANLYKNGVQERIQQQFGVEAQLWRRGFYATESDRPLTEVELKLFSSQ